MIRGSASKALGYGSFVLVKMDLCQDITGGSLSMLHRFGRVIKFTPTDDGYNLCTNPNSSSNSDRESYLTSAPYNGIHKFNTGVVSFTDPPILTWHRPTYDVVN